MARILIVGCGCRGQALARSLAADGHAVRGTTRDRARFAAIEAAGAEPYLGDPDRVGSLLYGFDSVTIVCWLMGDVADDALHATRLEMLFAKLVDTTVRGVACEAAGAAGPERLGRGRAVAEKARDTWEIPLAFVEADPAGHDAWLVAARAAVDRLLALGTRREFRETT
jgi:nucleoside-diphosphate-sugar epimerase